MKFRLKHSLAIALAAALTFPACGEEDPNNGNGNDTLAVDTVDTPPAHKWSDSDCENLGETEFCHSGLQFVKLQDEFIFANWELENATYKDTVFEEIAVGADGSDTTDWNVRMIDYPGGRVLLESDFDEDKYLNRIQIHTPDLTHPSGYRVGMSVDELRKLLPNLNAMAFPEYGVVEIFAAGDNHIIFHIPLEGVEVGEDGMIDATALPADARVMTIVLM